MSPAPVNRRELEPLALDAVFELCSVALMQLDAMISYLHSMPVSSLPWLAPFICKPRSPHATVGPGIRWCDGIQYLRVEQSAHSGAAEQLHEQQHLLVLSTGEDLRLRLKVSYGS